MPKDDYIELEGVVKEKLPNTTFTVELENGHSVGTYLWKNPQALYSYFAGG